MFVQELLSYNQFIVAVNTFICLHIWLAKVGNGDEVNEELAGKKKKYVIAGYLIYRAGPSYFFLYFSPVSCLFCFCYLLED